MLTGRFTVLEEIAERRAELQREQQGCSRAVEEARSRWLAKTAALAACRAEVDQVSRALQAKRRALDDLLGGRPLSAWRADLAALSEQRRVLDELAGVVRLLHASAAAISELDRRRERLDGERVDGDKRLQTLDQRQQQLEGELAEVRARAVLLDRIEGLADARQELKTGEPCPLCGSREHPFAGNSAPVDFSRDRLRDVEEAVKTVTTAGAELRIRQAEIGRDLDYVHVRRAEHEEVVDRVKKQIDRDGVAFALMSDQTDLAAALEKITAAQSDERKRLTTLVGGAEAAEQEVTAAREALERETAKQNDHERQLQDALHEKTSAEQSHERYAADQRALHERAVAALEQLHREVAPYRINIDLDHPGRARDELEHRRRQRLQQQAAYTELLKRSDTLDIEGRHLTERVDQLRAEIAKAQRQCEALAVQMTALQERRRELLGDVSPDDEERRLAAAVEAAEGEVEAARRVMQEATRALAAVRTGKETLERTVADRGLRLQELTKAFTRQLAALGFTDEADYAAACLPEEQRQELAGRAQALAEEKTELLLKERDKLHLLAQKREQRLSDQSHQEAEETMQRLVEAHRELQQEIGSVRRQLADNNEAKKQQQERLTVLTARQRECERWDALHQLIGSADGKKFRNFAQGVTFGLMIGHANRQLRQMTDRYLLIRDEAQPLELNVVDNYQAGEIRSTKNLSGGESFLVSLALALGLSQMASRNVQLDSLFLDEGFGTLDDEALDTALGTLAGLQQDGKLIGVISHVPALRERIATHIRVVPQSGGRSLIVGPGCRFGSPGIKTH